MSKLQNRVKKRNATANEIAKAIITHKMEAVFYMDFERCGYNDIYSDAFIKEINRHILKHVTSIEKKLGVYNDIETL
tara:strand:- start:6 stop:236 length:231 start_codon:yes stop_codon:yes gene_type:complete